GRHPSILASAMATLSELAPGRVRLGIGVGDSGANNMGVPRASLQELEQAVLAIKSLLSGGSMPSARDARSSSRSADPMSVKAVGAAASTDRPLRLSYAPSHSEVPVYVAAAGPRMQQLDGRVPDGALLSVSPAEM